MRQSQQRVRHVAAVVEAPTESQALLEQLRGLREGTALGRQVRAASSAPTEAMSQAPISSAIARLWVGEADAASMSPPAEASQPS